MGFDASTPEIVLTIKTLHMRGLLFAIVFCAFSLLLAEGIAFVLIHLEFIRPDEHDVVHSVIMLVMLACYLAFSPRCKDE
jgi:hypothetical protein